MRKGHNLEREMRNEAGSQIQADVCRLLPHWSRGKAYGTKVLSNADQAFSGLYFRAVDPISMLSVHVSSKIVIRVSSEWALLRELHALRSDGVFWSASVSFSSAASIHPHSRAWMIAGSSIGPGFSRQRVNSDPADVWTSGVTVPPDLRHCMLYS